MALGAVLHAGFASWDAYFIREGAQLAPAWSHWLGMFVLAFGLSWTTIDINQKTLKVVVGVLALLETVGLAWVLSLFGIGWSPMPTLFAGVTALAGGLYYSTTPAGIRKRRLWAAFGPPGLRLSRKKYREILESEAEFDVPDEGREASLVVCELVNSAELARSLSPAEYVALNTAFLNTGKQALLDAGGLLDEGGEGRLRGVFGLPLSEEIEGAEGAVTGTGNRLSPVAQAHARSACRAALRLGQRLDSFAEEAAQRWKVSLDYRIAVESGSLVGGHIGGSAQFTVMGELLDHTRRLCVANGVFGSHLLLGPDASLLAADAIEVRPVELVRFEGQKGPEEFYELLSMKGELPPEARDRRDAFWKGVIFFRSHRDDEAKAHFEGVLYPEESAVEDPLVRYYLKRLADTTAPRGPYDWSRRDFIVF